MRRFLLLCSALSLVTACSQTPEPQMQKREPLARVEPDPEPEDCVESDEVQRVLAARKQGFLACYADAVSLDPMLKGTVTLAFVIPPSGRVDHVNIAQSDLGNEALHECITEVAAGLEFAQKTCSLPRDIEYSVNLKRGSSEFVSAKD
jgi:hypothetical protein